MILKSAVAAARLSQIDITQPPYGFMGVPTASDRDIPNKQVSEQNFAFFHIFDKA